jgi:hypothetical protein
MPKLDGTHLPQRLAERLADLKTDKEVAARDVKALLSDEQVAAMNAAWEEQQMLRKVKRARTKEEEKELGWKTKREIYIEAYEKALIEANEDVGDAFDERLEKSEVRAARIYLDTYFAARDEGKESYQAHLAANNELKRAHLARVDDAQDDAMTRRFNQIEAMEDAIRAEIRKNMTPEELEQLEVLEEHEKALTKGRGKAGGRAGKP